MQASPDFCFRHKRVVPAADLCFRHENHCAYIFLQGKLSMTGKVWLVGAGPGDRGLFTIKGLEVLQNAEVVVYDALVGDEVLTLIPEQAEKINVGKRAGHHRMVQEKINQTLLEQALAGRRVVRLKGGDPFLFGRGGEELELLAENNIPYEVVPGVTSAFAVPAYNGIPVTHRDFTASVHIITGHRRASGNTHSIGLAEASRKENAISETGLGKTAAAASDITSDTEESSDSDDSDGLGIDYEALVRTRGTLIFLMGLSTLPVIMKGLLGAGISPDTPAAVLEKGTTAGQRRILATVATLEEKTKEAQIQPPAIIVVGEVCRLADSFTWAEKRPLAGKKILLTRPKELISGMASRLRKMGAEVLELPAIETLPIDPNPALDQCLEQYLQPENMPAENMLTQNTPAENTPAEKVHAENMPAGSAQGGAAGGLDWIVFTSPTGVRIFMDRFLEDHDIRSLAGIRFAVIGEGSAKKIRQYGIRPDFMPSVYEGETLGRELADKIRQERGESTGYSGTCTDTAKAANAAEAGETTQEKIQEKIQGKTGAGEAPVRILIPRAAIGSRELVEELKKAGNVDILDVPTYNTEYVTAGIVDARAQVENGEIDYAVFTSASTVRGFGAVMKDADLSKIKAICIGRQTRAAADAQGMETRMSERATLDALVDAVVKCAAEDRQ